MTREKAVLLATVNGEVVEVTGRVSTLGDELVTVRRARDVAEEKVLSLAAETAMTDRQWEAAEEQW
jgi:DNA/RNA endonuclease YhcR with UshA esterase domain